MKKLLLLCLFLLVFKPELGFSNCEVYSGSFTKNEKLIYQENQKLNAYNKELLNATGTRRQELANRLIPNVLKNIQNYQVQYNIAKTSFYSNNCDKALLDKYRKLNSTLPGGASNSSGNATLSAIIAPPTPTTLPFPAPGPLITVPTIPILTTPSTPSPSNPSPNPATSPGSATPNPTNSNSPAQPTATKLTCDQAKAKEKQLLKEIASLQKTDKTGKNLVTKLKEYNKLAKENAKCLKQESIIPLLAGDNLQCGSENDLAYYDPLFGKIAYCILYKAKDVTKNIMRGIFRNPMILNLGMAAVAIYITIFAYKVMLGMVKNIFADTIKTLFFSSFALLALNVDMIDLIMNSIDSFGNLIEEATLSSSLVTSEGASSSLTSVFQKLTKIFLDIATLGTLDSSGNQQLTVCVENYEPFAQAVVTSSIFTIIFALLFASGFGFFLVLALIAMLFYFVRLAINVFLIYISTQLGFLILASFVAIFAPLAIFEKFRKYLNTIAEFLIGNAVFFGLFIGAFFFGANILENSNENLCRAYSLILNDGTVRFRSLAKGENITADQINSAVSANYGGSSGSADLQDFLKNKCNGGGATPSPSPSPSPSPAPSTTPPTSGSGSSLTCIGGNPEATKVAGHSVSDRCHPAPVCGNAGRGSGPHGYPAKDFSCGTRTNAPAIANAFGIVTKVEELGCPSVPNLNTGSGYCSNGYGNNVSVYDCNEYTTFYAHLIPGSINAKVKVGDIVEAGQEIGLVGNSGHSFGVHLHFECRKNGSKIEPIDNCVELDALPGGLAGSSAESSSTESGKDSSDIFVPVILLKDEGANGWWEFVNRIVTHLIIIYFIFQFYENIIAFFRRLVGLGFNDTQSEKMLGVIEKATQNAKERIKSRILG